MSYIGKNPKADTLNLTPQSALPTTPSEGMLWRSDGTVRGVGLFEYKSGNWIQVDEQLGDSDTLDLQTSDGCNLTYNANWYSSGSLNIQGRSDTWGAEREDLSGTGTNDFITLSTAAADLLNSNGVSVIKFAPTDTTAGRNAYFGKRVDLQQGWRGSNLVVEFRYKTAETSGDTTDEDWLFVARDASIPPLEIASQGTNTLTTSALAAVVAEDGTTSVYKAPAVGDAIMLTDTSNNTYLRYITVVTGTANAGGTPVITYSGTDLTLPTGTTVNATAMPGIFTSLTQYLPAADSEGKSYKAQVKTDTDTKTIEYGIMHISTQTDQQIYVDNLLLSANKFLQASSQTKSETYSLYSGTFWDGTGIEWEWAHASLVAKGGTPPIAQSKLLRFEDNAVANPAHSTVAGTRIYAKEDILLSLAINCTLETGKEMYIYDSTGSNAPGIRQDQVTAFGIMGMTLASYKLSKGDYLSMGSNGIKYADGWFNITATPEASPVVILESQDQIFTDWVEYTPACQGLGTLEAETNVQWRRVGSNMEITGYIHFGTVSSTVAARIGLPSGYSIDGTIGGGDQRQIYGYYARNAGSDYYTGSNKMGVIALEPTSGGYTTVLLSAKSASNDLVEDSVANTYFSNDESIVFNFSVPIQGWNANFNPLMSLPLVDVGSNTEYFYSIKDGTSTASYGTSYGAVPWFDKEQKNTVSELGTITNTSAYGTYFTASQRVKVTAAYYVYVNATNYFDLGWAKNLTATEANAAITAAPDAKRLVVNCGQHNAYNLTRSIACTILLEPGETLFPATDKESIAAGVGSISFLVERDNSHTNMAHIIKPAVAILSEQVTGGSTASNAGGTSAAGFNQRRINTAEGETWFVSGSFTGINGTNVNWTLEPGLYEFDLSSTVYATDYSSHRLYDVTNSAEVPGSCSPTAYVPSGHGGHPSMQSKFTHNITSSTEFKIETYVTTGRSTDGLGTYNGNTSNNSVFSTVKIRKLK